MSDLSMVIPGSMSQLIMPWSSWKHRPVAGDLVIVMSTKPLTSVSPGWVHATMHIAYVPNFPPGMPDPLFTAVADDDDWMLQGFIGYPEGPDHG